MKSYAEICTFLFQLPRFATQGATAFRAGLGNMNALMEAMGNPHLAYPCVHVAGTNGKGSTSSMIAAMSTASGQKTGLHTSPHLFDFAERMRIDGTPASHLWLIEHVTHYQDVFESLKPSFFEASTALAFLYFAAMEVDMAIIEVGMGGRLDATNIITPAFSVITNIGFDHTEQLGYTLAAIATEKGGIIKESVPIITTETQPEALNTIKEIAFKKNAPCYTIDKETQVTDLKITLKNSVISFNSLQYQYDSLEVGLPGAHQVENAILAVQVAEFLDIPQNAIRRGLASVISLAGIRGRCEIISENPLVLADVAHNVEGLLTALAFQKEQTKGKRFVLFGTMSDKPIEKMVSLLASYEVIVLPITMEMPRALDLFTLVQHVENAQVETRILGDVAQGLKWFKLHAMPSDSLLITGSHMVVNQLQDV